MLAKCFRLKCSLCQGHVAFKNVCSKPEASVLDISLQFCINKTRWVTGSSGLPDTCHCCSSPSSHQLPPGHLRSSSRNVSAYEVRPSYVQRSSPEGHCPNNYPSWTLTAAVQHQQSAFGNLYSYSGSLGHCYTEFRITVTMPKKKLCRSFPLLPEASSIMKDSSA